MAWEKSDDGGLFYIPEEFEKPKADDINWSTSTVTHNYFDTAEMVQYIEPYKRKSIKDKIRDKVYRK